MAEDSQTAGNFSVRIVVEEKNMKAYLVLEPDSSSQTILSPEEINKSIEKSGVKFGIIADTVKQICESAREGKFLIAEGTPPQPGEDSKFEYYFQTDKSLRPKILEDGHTDYKDVSLVESVAKDAVLIRKIPVVPGNNGRDVYGKEISAPQGKNLDISAGQGTYKDPNDPSLIKSSVEGIIFFNENKKSIEVQKLYVVQKSVDFSTGNINVKSAVDIHGNVSQHFSVITPYNIQVKGVIENATIKCGGSLSAFGGIMGDNKQLIEVAGDIHASYIINQRIRCNGSVYANTEIRNATIECDDEVVLVKESGVIIGGRISASNKVSAPSIGNAYGVGTEIEVGVKIEFREKFIAKEAEKNAMQKHVDEIRKEIEEAEEKKPDDIGSAYLKKLHERLKETGERLEVLRKEFKEIEASYHDVSDASVIASKRVFPGTIIRIKNASYEVKEELNKVKFVYEDGAVKCVGAK